MPVAGFRGFDGAELALTEIGEGRPIILLHGLFSSADMNWQRFGAAAEIDDHLNRGRNMDTRTPQEQCAHVV